MSQSAQKERIVILGGGIGALSAAFALSRPGWQERFASITVYQMGWRLGGKGASGRGQFGRIEEHGLHLWLGFYENAFRVMQECYAELGRPAGAPLARWDDAFKKASVVGAEDRFHNQWFHWVIDFPEDHRVPGVPDPHEPIYTIWLYVKRALAAMHRFVVSLDEVLGQPTKPANAPHGLWQTVHADLSHLRAEVEAHITGAEDMALVAALELADALAPDANQHTTEHHDLLLRLLEAFISSMRKAVATLVDQNEQVHRLWALIELSHVNIRGVIRSKLLTHPDGFAALNHLEYSDWLRDNGASPDVLDGAMLRFLYDLAFAYREGNPQKRGLAAGIALQAITKIFFRYKGAIFWKMQAGMGDVVFTPLYQVLKKRGVQFQFFHRVTNLRLSADRQSIAAVDLVRQVDLVDAGQEYQPLIDVKGLPCWPAEPLYDQIRQGDALRGHNLESFWTQWQDVGSVTLTAGQDFTHLVLGISLGSLPSICKELIAHNPRWQMMVQKVETIQTQAFQLWLSASSEELGWNFSQVDLSGYVEPFDTWADMRQLIPVEAWPADHTVKGIAYFCNVMETPTPLPPPDQHEFPIQQTARVKANALTFLRQHVAHLWPQAVDSHTQDFRWELLVDTNQAEGAQRFNSQFWRANTDPSERYVLAVPGSNQYRLKTNATGYANLYITGDWIDCGFNVGCVEAAVMAGLETSAAITGFPPLKDIVGATDE